MPTQPITIKEAAEKYIEHLREVGKNEKTVYTYGKDLDLAIEHFGADKDIAKILPVHVAGFFKADIVNKLIREPKKEGEPRQERPKSEITITKTKRVFRQMLVFCKEQGLVSKIALPKDELARVKKSANPEQPEAAEQPSTEAE